MNQMLGTWFEPHWIELLVILAHIEHFVFKNKLYIKKTTIR